MMNVAADSRLVITHYKKVTTNKIRNKQRFKQQTKVRFCRKVACEN